MINRRFFLKAIAAGAGAVAVPAVVNNRLLASVPPLPGSHIGDRGYLGARIQPNSPTDDVDDIR